MNTPAQNFITVNVMRVCQRPRYIAASCKVMALIVALTTWMEGRAFAQHSDETEKSQAELQNNNSDYQKCRRDSLKLIKEGKISADGFKARVEACTERFPVASIYIECKKNALDQRNKDVIKKILKHCKQQLLRYSFDKNEPFPFFSHQKKLFFAGVGLNEVLPIQNFKLPNFECKNLPETLTTPKKSEFFLFGNHPKVFMGFRVIKPHALMRSLKITSNPPKDGIFVDGLGKIFGDIAKVSGSIFFPTSFCVYSGEFGPHFSGMSAYYLLDFKEKLATPYFGISFYKGKTTKIQDVAKSLTQLLKDLGAEKVKQSSLEGKVIFFGNEEIFSFDEEGDPRDLCKAPRRMAYIGAIKKSSDAPEYPEYALVANVKNLCDYGDQISLRFKTD